MGHDHDRVGRTIARATGTAQPRLAAGKRTLTESVVAPAPATPEPGAAVVGSVSAGSGSAALAVPANGGRRRSFDDRGGGGFLQAPGCDRPSDLASDGETEHGRETGLDAEGVYDGEDGENGRDRKTGLDADGEDGEKERDREKGLGAEDHGHRENTAGQAARFGPATAELRLRLQATEGHRAMIESLRSGIGPRLRERENDYIKLSQRESDYNEIAGFCEDGKQCESLSRPFDEGAVFALVGRVGELWSLYREVMWTLIPAYERLCRMNQPDQIPTLKQFRTSVAYVKDQDSRLAYQAELAVQYGETLQQLEDLEKRIEDAHARLADPVVGLVLDDLSVLRKALRKMDQAGQQHEQKEKAGRKEQKAQSMYWFGVNVTVLVEGYGD